MRCNSSTCWKAILENGLGDGADAFGDGIQRAKLRLHIGRETRDRVAVRISTACGRRPCMSSRDPVVAGVDLRTCLLQFLQDGFEVFGRRVGLPDAGRPSSAARDQVGAGLDTVGQHRDVSCRTKLTTPLNPDRACARRLRSPPPLLFRKVAPGRPPPALGRRFPAAVSPSASTAAIIRFSVPVTVTVSKTMCAPCRRSCPCPDVAVAPRDVRTHRLQPLDVQIDGPRADRAAARQRDVGLTESGDQRTEHENRRAHRLDQFVGGASRTRRASTSRRFTLHPVVESDFGTHALQQRDASSRRP